MHAYCYASGLIEFGNRVPRGAIAFAHGPDKALRAFVEVHARHGYSTRLVKGRPTKIKGSDTLLVPGIPEAEGDDAKLDALQSWCGWIGSKLPVGVAMLGWRGIAAAEAEKEVA